MANYLRKTFLGTSYFFIFGLLGALFSYLARIYMTKKLSVADVGLFFAVFSLISFLEQFKDLGMGHALVKFVSQFNASKNYRKIKEVVIVSSSIQFISTIIIAVVIFLLAQFLSVNYFKDPASLTLIYILLGWFVLSSISTFIFSIFNSFHRFFIGSSKEIVRKLSFFVLLIVFIHFGFGVLSPALAWLITSTLLILIYMPFLIPYRKIFSEKITTIKSTTKEVVSFGFPVLLTSVGSMVIAYLDSLLLTYYRTLEEVGVYNMVIASALLLLFLSRSLSTVIFPITSELITLKKHHELEKGISLILKYIILILVPIGSLLFILAKPFLGFLFGPAYVIGSSSLQILVIGMLFIAIGTITNSVISALGKPKIVTMIILFSSTVNLVLNILLIPTYGIVGAALTTSLSYFLVMILSLFMLRKNISFSIPWKDWINTLLGGFLLVVVFSFSHSQFENNSINLILSSIISVVLYLFWILIVKVVSVNELKQVFQRLLKK